MITLAVSLSLAAALPLTTVPLTPAISAEKPGEKAPGKTKRATIKSGDLVKNIEDLPDLTREMYESLVEAAANGELEEMRDIFESNELAPIISNDHTGKPLDVWKDQSVDGTARDVMATLLNILARPPVKTADGDYVWPYFARTDLKSLTTRQQIELFQMAGPKMASEMLKQGTYTYYEVKIGKDGTWHSFHRKQ